MNKLMLIDSIDESNIQIAIVENGKLANFFFESNENNSTVGNVYLGRIDHVEHSLQAYFVDYGAGKNGFLSFSASKDPLVKNQKIIVQIVKDEKENKGAMLTTFVEIKSLFLVALINKPKGCSISKKISAKSDRELMQSWHAKLNVEHNCHLIFRHAALDKKYKHISQDFEKIKSKIDCIYAAAEKSKVRLLIKSQSIIEKAIIDYYKPGTEVYVEGQIPSYISSYAKKYNKAVPIFKFHDVENQIEALFCDRVNLPSGGYINIQHTEALTSIDVNSGVCKKENSIDKTALFTNLEAAREIAHQLILRDIGGLIVIDFIDMYQKQSMEMLEKQISSSMAGDKAKYNLGELDRFSLFAISRQQLRKNTFLSMHKRCVTCHGVGFVRKDSAMSAFILRQITNLIKQRTVQSILIKCRSDLVFYMLNHKKDIICFLENSYDKKIHFETNVMVDKTQILYKEKDEFHEYDLRDIEKEIQSGEFRVTEDEIVLDKTKSVQSSDKAEPLKICITREDKKYNDFNDSILKNNYIEFIEPRMSIHKTPHSFLAKEPVIFVNNQVVGII